MREFVVVIPARLNSGRLDRKPLADICGQPMILHTYQRALEATSRDNIFVATDDDEIMNVCSDANMNCILTSQECRTGTDRIAEVSQKIKSRIYINLQGDEPIMEASNIVKMINAGINEPDSIINAWAKINNEEEFVSRTIPKVVVTANDYLMYMSRSPIPGNKSNEFVKAKKQVCVYSFPFDALQFFSENPHKTAIEQIEDIEILRFLEMGWSVKMIELSGNSIAVDTPEDLELVRNIMQNRTRSMDHIEL